MGVEKPPTPMDAPKRKETNKQYKHKTVLTTYTANCKWLHVIGGRTGRREESDRRERETETDLAASKPAVARWASARERHTYRKRERHDMRTKGLNAKLLRKEQTVHGDGRRSRAGVVIQNTNTQRAHTISGGGGWG
jgi:hypothetical protein